MKIYCVVTPSHRVLFERFFLPSLDQERFELHVLDHALAGKGDFLAEDFKEAIRFKLEAILSSISENVGSVIVWSDVDIQFFGLQPEHLLQVMEQPGLDFAAQRLNRTSEAACGGFYTIRCSAKTLGFFERVKSLTGSHTNGNEQDAINLLLREGALNWQLLGPEFYARTHGLRVPEKALLHHATCVLPGDSVQQKIRMLTGLEHYGQWSPLSKIRYHLKELPGAVARRLQSRLPRKKSASQPSAHCPS